MVSEFTCFILLLRLTDPPGNVPVGSLSKARCRGTRNFVEFIIVSAPEPAVFGSSPLLVVIRLLTQQVL